MCVGGVHPAVGEQPPRLAPPPARRPLQGRPKVRRTPRVDANLRNNVLLNYTTIIDPYLNIKYSQTFTSLTIMMIMLRIKYGGLRAAIILSFLFCDLVFARGFPNLAESVHLECFFGELRTVSVRPDCSRDLCGAGGAGSRRRLSPGLLAALPRARSGSSFSIQARAGGVCGACTRPAPAPWPGTGR